MMLTGSPLACPIIQTTSEEPCPSRGVRVLRDVRSVVRTRPKLPYVSFARTYGRLTRAQCRVNVERALHSILGRAAMSGSPPEAYDCAEADRNDDPRQNHEERHRFILL